MGNSVPFHLDDYEILDARISYQFKKCTKRYFELRHKYPAGLMHDEQEAQEFHALKAKIDVIREIRLGVEI